LTGFPALTLNISEKRREEKRREEKRREAGEDICFKYYEGT